MSKKAQAYALFNQGKKPSSPEVKDLGLKPKTTYNYYQEWKKVGGVMGFKEEEGEQGKGQGSSLPTTTDIGAAQLVRFTGVRIDCEYTPIMYIARQAAAEEWNWSPDIRFEDFLDTILYWFFKDRGITLQGYIVEEEQGNGN